MKRGAVNEYRKIIRKLSNNATATSKINTELQWNGDLFVNIFYAFPVLRKLCCYDMS